MRVPSTLAALAPVAAIVLVFNTPVRADEGDSAPWSVTSPGENLSVTVVLENLGDPYPDEEGLYFNVSLDGRQVLPFSPLGVTMRDADFVRDLKPVGQTDRVIDETYPMPSGKKSTHRNRANETTLLFENGQGNAMHVVFRAYDDGIAYRYHFPGAGTREITAEASAFRLPPGSTGWFQPYSVNHETLYAKHVGRQTDAEDATTDMGLELRFSKVSGINAVVSKIELWSDREPRKPVQRIEAQGDLDPPDGFHLVACDDCGFESLQPHCTEGLDFVYSEEHVPYSVVAADDPARSVSFGWDSVLYRFAELAPEARYKLFVTYLSHDDTRVMALSANGHPLRDAFTLPKQKVTVRQFDIPQGVVGEIPRASGHDVGFPALVYTPSDAWVLLTEAAVYGDYGGAHLAGSLDGPSIFRVTLPQDLSGELPWTTPWRVAVVGEEMGTIVESVLVDNLNPPCEIEDTSWITPGRVTFPWWSDTAVSGNFERLKEFVDLAHRMGWEWIEFDTALVHGRPDCSLTDAWMTLPWVAELVEYARARGVKVYGWDHWQNLDTPEKREQVLGRFQELGIEGVKIDFLDSDSQQRFQFRDEVIRDCLERRLVVSFHGATVPRGQRRRWPNVLTWEAVKGSEWYIIARSWPTPEYNCTLPFTRNVVGPMDSCPVTFTAERKTTTNAHELALSVIYESGWQNISDTPEAYAASPGSPFLREVHAAWDDIHFIDGHPGEFVCLARRKANDWFIAAINADSQRTLEVPLDFLNPGTYRVKLYRDDEAAADIAVEDVTLQTTKPLTITLPSGGGFCMRVADSYAGPQDQ